VAGRSGEMKDTVPLNTLAVNGLEKFFSGEERPCLLGTFGRTSSMLPKKWLMQYGHIWIGYQTMTKTLTILFRLAVSSAFSVGVALIFQKQFG
jgi:hypothetical protein